MGGNCSPTSFYVPRRRHVGFSDCVCTRHFRRSPPSDSMHTAAPWLAEDQRTRRITIDGWGQRLASPRDEIHRWRGEFRPYLAPRRRPRHGKAVCVTADWLDVCLRHPSGRQVRTRRLHSARIPSQSTRSHATTSRPRTPQTLPQLSWTPTNTTPTPPTGTDDFEFWPKHVDFIGFH